MLNLKTLAFVTVVNLTMHPIRSVLEAFNSVKRINKDVNKR